MRNFFSGSYKILAGKKVKIKNRPKYSQYAYFLIYLLPSILLITAG